MDQSNTKYSKYNNLNHTTRKNKPNRVTNIMTQEEKTKLTQQLERHNDKVRKCTDEPLELHLTKRLAKYAISIENPLNMSKTLIFISKPISD
jgi:hypothetical protein